MLKWNSFHKNIQVTLQSKNYECTQPPFSRPVGKFGVSTKKKKRMIIIGLHCDLISRFFLSECFRAHIKNRHLFPHSFMNKKTHHEPPNVVIVKLFYLNNIFSPLPTSQLTIIVIMSCSGKNGWDPVVFLKKIRWEMSAPCWAAYFVDKDISSLIFSYNNYQCIHHSTNICEMYAVYIFLVVNNDENWWWWWFGVNKEAIRYIYHATTWTFPKCPDTLSRSCVRDVERGWKKWVPFYTPIMWSVASILVTLNYSPFLWYSSLKNGPTFYSTQTSRYIVFFFW